tara:strand:- start:2265 stop:2723 length:459 start_codon:yes stop_codon:yes gene_type:complete
MTALTVPTNGIYPYIKDPETIPERFVQLGGDRTRFSYDLGFNFAANHTSPYKNDAYNGESRITALSMTPVQAPIQRGTMNTTVETYNASNLNPRTLLNYAQPGTYGVARNQVSLLTDPVRNRDGRELPVNNRAMFQAVEDDKRMVKIPQKPL